MTIKPIKTRADHKAALCEIERLWGADEGTQEGDRLDVLATLVEAYEQAHFPMDAPDPVEAIKFRLEQQGTDQKALIGLIGNRTRVYEVLRRDRALSLSMIRRLNQRLKIPDEVLIRPVRVRRRNG
ncbi:MAG TPA: transcriptional regulator [Terriglobia bacterium]|nr:transcriptional regulator [Terriglobia bacterium]